MRAKNILFFTFITVILILPSTKADLNLTEVYAKIFRDGWVKIVETYTTNKTFIFLKLPETSEIIAVIGDNEPLPYKISNNTVYIETKQKNEIKVIYYTQSFTNKIGSLWTIQLNFNTTNLIVEFPPNTTIAGLSTVPQLITQHNNTIILKFTTGNITLRYYLSPPPDEIKNKVTKNQQTKTRKEQQPKEKLQNAEFIEASKNNTAVPNTTNMKESQETTQTPNQPQNNILWHLIPGIVALAAISLILLFYKTKKTDKLAELSEEEADIIHFLRKVGGRAYQSDIMKALGLPKTSTWRYIKKLEEKNLVKIERKRGKNLIILK